MEIMCFLCCHVVGQTIVLLITGLVARLLASVIVVLGNKFNWKEEIFIAMAWLPKATVQVSFTLHLVLFCSRRIHYLYGRRWSVILKLGDIQATRIFLFLFFGSCMLHSCMISAK